jgi:hypothetical protein
MELFLNLLWLVIALGSFARWRHVVGVRRGSRGRLQGAVRFLALACALSILFPAISVTDNLHPELYVTEDSSSSRRAMAAAVGASHALFNRFGHASPPALVPGLTLPFSFGVVLESLRIPNFVDLAATLARVLPSRAPPSL